MVHSWVGAVALFGLQSVGGLVDVWNLAVDGEEGSIQSLCTSGGGACRTQAHWVFAARSTPDALAPINASASVSAGEGTVDVYSEAHLVPTAGGQAQVWTVNWRVASAVDGRGVCACLEAACSCFNTTVTMEDAGVARDAARLRFGNWSWTGGRLLGHVALDARIGADVAAQNLTASAEVSIDGGDFLQGGSVESLAFFDGDVERDPVVWYERFHFAFDAAVAARPESVCYRVAFYPGPESPTRTLAWMRTDEPAWPSGYALDDHTRCWSFGEVGLPGREILGR